MKDVNKRFRQIREKCEKTQEELADIIGISRSGVTLIESGQRNVNDKHIKLLCVEHIDGKYIDEKWLRTGEGEMFIQLPEEDEVAAYVSDLLEDDGKNQLYTLIKEIMHTYNALSPKSKKVLCEFSGKLTENLKRKEG